MKRGLRSILITAAVLSERRLFLLSGENKPERTGPERRPIAPLIPKKAF